ncbi:hypothetical protein ACFL2V_01420 [Pseudomonadota bacterium]
MACFNSKFCQVTYLSKGKYRPLFAFTHLLAASFIAASSCHAEFELNFEPVAQNFQPVETHWGIGPPLSYWNDQGTPEVWDDRYTRWVDYSNISFGEAGTRLYGQSPFLIDHWSGGEQTPELVTDPSNGKQYWHVVVIDPFNDFMQEVFIETAAGVEYGTADGGYTINKSHPVVQPEWVTYYDIPGSASGGGLNDYNLLGASQYEGGNQSRIFSANAGNGTGDPRKVIIRQVLDDGQIQMEFLKDKYDKKPKITQTLKNANIDMYFELDMRNLDYVSEQTTAGTMINQISLTGPGSPGDIASFDSTKAQALHKSRVSAGKFIYVEPDPFTSGLTPENGHAAGSGGTYTYEGGSYDHYSIEWAYYLDPATYTGATIQVSDDSTPDPNDTTSLTLAGVSLEDRFDIKGNGWEWQGYGAPVWWIQKSETPTYGTSQAVNPFVNPWSYSQENFCDYGPC